MGGAPVALVTGAAGGIGRALTPMLVAQGLGVIGVDVAPRADCSGVEWHCADLANPAAVRSMVARIHPGTRHRLTAVAHLAGVYPVQPLEAYTVDLWDRVMAVNVRSAFLLVQALLAAGVPNLRSIVLTSSAAAKVGSRDPAYAASKAALVGLGRSLSLALAGRGVRVNMVLPGLIATRMSQAQTDERRAQHVARTLAGRPGEAVEAANLIAFLLSDAASYLWGASIDVNGGMAL